MDDPDFGFRIREKPAVEVEQDDDQMNEEEWSAQESSLMSEQARRLDIDALFHCVSSKRKAYRSSLLLDYGAMHDIAQEQYFYIQREHEVGPNIVSRLIAAFCVA